MPTSRLKRLARFFSRPQVSNDLESRVVHLEKQSALVEAHFTDAFWKALDVAYEAILPGRKLCCIICDHSAEREAWEIRTDRCIFNGGKLERYCCPKCQCIFGPQKYLDLDEPFVSRDYQVLYTRYKESDSTANELKTFHSLNPDPCGRYLDWGCGGTWSRTVAELRVMHYDVWGYEPSAAEPSDFVMTQRDAIPSGFDGIFSNNVIEHFRRPVEQFKDFHSILKVGGTMAHSSPCYEYRYPFTRFHALFLMGKSPDILAERTGFKVVSRTQHGDYINLVFARV